MGSYGNQIWVHAPAHMPKSNGYCLDRCVAEEVMQLWLLGITTTGCCCGHGKADPYIGVVDDDIGTMRMMDYENCPNASRPGAEDSFYPTGRKNLSRIFGGEVGTFVLQSRKEGSEEWRDYLKYNPSKIGSVAGEPNLRIVYYPNVMSRSVPYSIGLFRGGHGEMEKLNCGPPITQLQQIPQLK